MLTWLLISGKVYYLSVCFLLLRLFSRVCLSIVLSCLAASLFFSRVCCTIRECMQASELLFYIFVFVYGTCNLQQQHSRCASLAVVLCLRVFPMVEAS